MKNILKISICSLLLFSSCAKHIYVDYQYESENTGRIVLQPTKATEKTFVYIYNNIIVNKKNVKSVTINNVPVGMHDVYYSIDSWIYKEALDANYKIDVKKNNEIAKIVTVPPYSTGYWVAASLSAIIPIIITIISVEDATYYDDPYYY